MRHSPASQGSHGAPRVFLDLREAGETCSKHRVARLMRVNHLRALHGYRTRRWSVGKPSVLIPNLLQRQFTVTRRNKAWGNSKRLTSCADKVSTKSWELQKPFQVS